MVSPGENAEFSCSADANPLDESHIKWKRDGFDFGSRATITFSNQTRSSYLYVRDVKADESGIFTCVVNNGIGMEVQNVTFLLVRSKLHQFVAFIIYTIIIPGKPQIDEAPSLAKAASDKGQVGNLTCRAKGAPEIEFSWGRRGTFIDPENSNGKFEITTRAIDK